MKEITMCQLKVGQTLITREPLLGVGDTEYFTYCGMPTPETFCIQQTHQWLISHYQPNCSKPTLYQTLITQTPLFYPKDRKRIGSFQVNEVNPKSITLEEIVE